ncbi:hypothetical protein V1509DRAFT_622888 [Lipomyces kononenkoae]
MGIILATRVWRLVVSGVIACILFVSSPSSATTSPSLAPLSQIVQTESIPPDVYSIFTHYFPSSLLTDYSAVSHELSLLMDSTGVTIFGGTNGALTSTIISSESSGSNGVSGSAAPTAVSTTVSATTAIPSTVSAITSSTATTPTSTSMTATGPSTSTTSTAGAARFIGSPSCLAISVACLFGTIF